MATLPADRDERVLSLMGLCKWIAWDICRTIPNADFDDLMQDAWLGAIDAVGKYDESRGLELSTYASRRIRGAVIDGLRVRDPLKRPHRLRLTKAGETITTNSLDCEVAIDGSLATFADLLVAPDGEQGFIGVEDRDAVRRALECLPDRLFFVVTEYYYHDRTLVDIALELGVSESRVSQMITKAREWLKVALRDSYIDFGENELDEAHSALA